MRDALNNSLWGFWKNGAPPARFDILWYFRLEKNPGFASNRDTGLIVHVKRAERVP